jgi:hypothetical protein
MKTKRETVVLLSLVSNFVEQVLVVRELARAAA